MAPGCGSNLYYKQQSSSSSLDMIDSFEVLEQTVMKQKRLTKKKKSDLRMKILLKRTFDLVCEIMDRENGFNELIDDALSSANDNSTNSRDEELLLHVHDEDDSDDLNLFETSTSEPLEEDNVNSKSTSSSSESFNNNSSSSSNLSCTNNTLNQPHNLSIYSSTVVDQNDNQLVPSFTNLSNIPLPQESTDDTTSYYYNTNNYYNDQHHQTSTTITTTTSDDKIKNLTQLKRKYEANKSNLMANKRLKLIDQNIKSSSSNSSSSSKKKSHKKHKSSSSRVACM